MKQILGLIINLFCLLLLTGGACQKKQKNAIECPSTAVAWDSLRAEVTATDSTLLGAKNYINCLENRLQYFHDTIYSSSPRDWLANHPEKGQTFLEYATSQPIGANQQRQFIYIQKVGPFNEAEAKIIEDAAKYLAIFFDLPTKVLESIPLESIPKTAKRNSPYGKQEQIQSSYLLQILAEKIPDDASVYIGFTATDLYPAANWNYVFGQASLRNRVGIWSIFRFGQPSESKETYQKCLKRALKTATHETGHMYSIKHCIAYNCNMSGSNHLNELDRRSAYFCPQCLAKISWNLNINELERFQMLEEFWQEKEEKTFAKYYQQAQKVLLR